MFDINYAFNIGCPILSHPHICPQIELMIVFCFSARHLALVGKLWFGCINNELNVIDIIGCFLFGTINVLSSEMVFASYQVA